MKAILQRVSNASVAGIHASKYVKAREARFSRILFLPYNTHLSFQVDGIEISSIGKGILVLIGLSVTDTDEDAEYIARKILKIRLFEDENQKRWAKSTSDLSLEILCVSQFTLHHKLKGYKPDFHQAMGSKESKVLYGKLLSILQTSYNPSLIKDGVFGAHMCVKLENDGPVTLEIDSNSKKQLL